MNVKFSYLYRDAGNYKNFGEYIFSNKTKISLQEILCTIKRHLIDGEWFVAADWDLPDLHFREFTWDSNLDHEWHEFESVTFTSELPSEEVDIESFLRRISLL